MISVEKGLAASVSFFFLRTMFERWKKANMVSMCPDRKGGRAAEEIIFGELEVTTGAAGDLQQITSLSKQILRLMDASTQGGDVIVRMMARNSMSKKIAEDIDAAIKLISNEAYELH